ncbi:MAG: hypothetical protein AAFY65_11230 [Pseudomonadota bacterium]
MSSDIRAILHIGAPKCGSSALQTALSQTPDVSGDAGQFAYTALVHQRAGRVQTLSGRRLRRAARRSIFGYQSCPSLPTEAQAPETWDALRRVLRADADGGGPTRPILSNESWLAHSTRFGQILQDAGNPPVRAFAYVRPPLDWLNAAYWQWGLWTGLSFGDWLSRWNMPYRMGTQLDDWATIPGVQLNVRLLDRDVVDSFATDLGVTLPRPARANTASAPALLGFLLRNRAQFRPGPHAAANEFVVARWCPDLPRRALWALNPADVRRVRGENGAEVRRLMAHLPEASLHSDPRWTEEWPYHELIKGGRTYLRDMDEIATLFDSLVAGVRRATEASGARCPDMPRTPPPGTDIEGWDAAIAQVFVTLIKADQQWRLGRGRAWLKSWLRSRDGLADHGRTTGGKQGLRTTSSGK